MGSLYNYTRADFAICGLLSVTSNILTALTNEISHKEKVCPV